MKKAIFLVLLIILAVITGCKKNETQTVIIEPSQNQQTQNVTQPITPTQPAENNTEDLNEQPAEVEVCEGTCGSPAIDLSNYPTPFIKDEKLNAYIIVGADATSLEVVAATELLNGIPFKSIISPYTPSAVDKDLTSIANKNAILIGNPCNNKFIAKLMPYQNNCVENLKSGEAIIKLFKTGSDSYALVVGGYSGQDTRRAAQYLGNYKTKTMQGIEMKV